MSIKLGNTNVSSILGSSGAATGDTDYPDLTNKPSINGITLVGNKTTEELGITVSTDDFYTKTETDNKINTVVSTAVQPKADKTYVDNQLNLKVSNSDLNSALALKADKSTTYTKTETDAAINSAMATKADISYVNTSLDGKASISDVYDKDEVDEQLDAIENAIGRSLATKADKSTTYTKTETDAAINTAVADKATTTYVNAELATKANQATTYTKTEVDDLISSTGPSGDTLPVGAIIPYSGQTTPENWLLCDGREVSRTTYNKLFNVIGTIYGDGDGSTSFNLPNLKGRVPVGTSNDITLGQTLGEKEHTLTVEEMPSHNHNLFISGSGSSGTWGATISKSGNGPDKGAIINTGGGQPHNIMQPSIGQNYIIKAKQSAGLVATVVDSLTSTSTTDALSANQGRILNSRRLIKLWENPNPTSSFAAQTITLASDDYDYLIWFFKPYSGWDRLNSDMTLKGFGINLIFAGSGQLSDGINWKVANFNRAITRVDDTNFNVALATMATPNGDSYAGNGLSNGEWCIPIAVYGGKF